MKDKIEKFQSAVVAGFSVISLASTCIPYAIKTVKSGVHSGYKETGIHQMLFATPAPKKAPRRNK
jgi:hypothetical protein